MLSVMRKPWKRVLSTALSLLMCGSMAAPALSGGAALAEETVKIACIGDSITAGSGASSSTFQYPTQLQGLLGSGYEVKNYGISGRTMLSKGDNPYINESQYTQSQEWQPDYVILMLGTNDSKPQNWAYKDEFETDMKGIITTYQELASEPTVIVATSPTVGATNIGISEEVVTGEIVPLQKKVAAEMGCPVIDINALTKGAPQNYGDGIHPNDEGYAAMAKMFYDGLQDIFNARIQSFSVNGMQAAIDDEAGSISLTLPHGTDLKSIEPSITLADGAKIDRTGAQDFTSPVSYTVTSPDGKDTKTYTATIKAQDIIKVACVGDSITAGAGGNGTSYPQELARLLGDSYDVRNFGNSGKTLLKDGVDGANTPSGYVTTDTYQNSLAFNPDIVIFMLGTNDSKPQNWNTLGDQFEQEMRELLEVYMNLPSHPQVYVATSPTAHNNGGYAIQPAVIHDEIVPIQKKVAAELGLPVIDMHAMTADNSDEFPDNIHPNDAGYRRMAGDFANFIQRDVTTLSSLTINGAVGVIDGEKDTITVTLPAATDVTALQPVLEIPEGAAYSPVGPQNFTSPVTYTVTAADGTTTRDYTVTVDVLDPIKIACVGDSMTAAAEYPNDLEGFLGDGYEIGRFGVNSTTAQKDGLKEGLPNPVSGAYIDHPQYQQSLDFEPDIVLLTLGSNDSKQGEGQQQSGYDLVTNWTEDSPEKFEADLKELVASYQAIGATVVLGTSPSGYTTENNWGAKPEIVNSQIAPIQRKVAADMGCFLVDFNAMTQGKENSLIGGDGLHPNFNGYYLLASQHYLAIQDIQAAICSFSIGDAPGIISHIDKTVYVSVPDGTDLTALTPTMTLAQGAVSGKSGQQNFGQPVEYTITSAAGWTSTYTVSVTSPSGVLVSKIEMLTLPEKTSYLLGEELDLTGASIAVTYTDGSRETLPVTSDMVSGYDWLNATKQTLTVAYEGKETTFKVQVDPYGVVGTFSAMSGDFTVLHNGENLLYADWKYADAYPIDVSGDRSKYHLELDVTFQSENPEVDPSQMWQWLTVKLRSSDVKDKEGDPDLKVNGGAYETNSEHNYGWDLQSSDFKEAGMDTGTLHLSIPLDQACTNHRGIVDWSDINRIIITCPLYDAYRTESIQHSMNIQNVRIVDVTQTPAAPDTQALAAAVQEAQGIDPSGYTDETAEAFRQALARAQAYLTNPYASQERVDSVAKALKDAAEGLVPKPAVTLGDVDGRDGVTSADALLALQAATGKVELSAEQEEAADVDTAPGVTAADALLILQYATQKIDAFPVESSSQA